MSATLPSAAVEAILEEIAEEKSDGATSLAARGLDALELLADDLPEEKREALDCITELARRIDGLRPTLAAIGVQAVLALARTDALVAQGMGPAFALRQAIRVERETLGQADSTISSLARRELGAGGVMATCSWSVTAARGLVAIKPERVVIGEGHRLGDGLRCAKWLAARGLEVEVVPDGALPVSIREARAVLVGADQLLADGAVVNRCCTFSMALAADHYGVPFYVACQRIKLGGRSAAPLEESPGLFGVLPTGVTSRVPLFDVTPCALVRAVITESGVMSPGQAGEIGARIADLRKRYFETG